MARFYDQLRRYLENTRGGPSVGTEPRFRVDVAELRQHFLQRLRHREKRAPRWVERIHREWSSELEAFTHYIEASGNAEVVGDGLSPQIYAAMVLDAALSCLDPEVPLVTQLELKRVSAGFVPGAQHVREYCMETRLIRHESGADPRLTALGRVFLRLRGKDALRWMLTVEVSQSQGDYDPWRASRLLLEEALERGISREEGWEGSMYFPFSQSSLDRLHGYGVLIPVVDEPSEEAEILDYHVPPPMGDVVRAVLDQGPWHAAVTALLEDERALVLPVSGPTSTDATIEQTRMIAHEVRNALIPVRYNMEDLLSEDEDLEQHPRTRMELAKKGVLRVLEFVDQLVATSELITEPSTRFDVGHLLREVLGWVDETESVMLDLPEESPYIRAPRSLLLRAFLDVVRNALHSATPPPPVRLSARRHGREVRIVVDDGGPGIPPELRARVFDDGFTTRPGGSGFGLAFLRRVVERELRGTVSCEESDLGGARFTISIPDSEEQP